MRDLAVLAEQIRAVRDAQRRFMGRWRLEQVLVGADVLDRLADDMAAAHRELDETGHDAARGTDAAPRGGRFGYPPPRSWTMYTNGGADGAS